MSGLQLSIALGGLEDVVPSDLSLQCGSTVFNVHRVMLAAASPVFGATTSGLEAGEQEPIPMPDEASAMHDVLRIIYGDHACGSDVSIPDVKALAFKYDVKVVIAVLKTHQDMQELHQESATLQRRIAVQEERSQHQITKLRAQEERSQHQIAKLRAQEERSQAKLKEQQECSTALRKQMSMFSGKEISIRTYQWRKEEERRQDPRYGEKFSGAYFKRRGPYFSSFV
jgi:hypothetical protein